MVALFMQFRHTPLHLASEGGHTETVKVLLKKGADPNNLNDKVRNVPLFKYISHLRPSTLHVTSNMFIRVSGVGTTGAPGAECKIQKGWDVSWNITFPINEMVYRGSGRLFNQRYLIS